MHSKLPRKYGYWLSAALSWLVSLVALSADVDFEKMVWPILKENCLDCHGPDKQRSGLRVDRRVNLLKGGDSGLAAIVPSEAASSHILTLVKGFDPDYRMPPKGEALTGPQIAVLESWIDDGARWPGQMNELVEEVTDHWSFQPVTRPTVPVSTKKAIDYFLEERLKLAHLTANERAEAQALIRRASIILTGLPPTFDRVEQFVIESDRNADEAYEQLVDELLRSRHFGERWAQHWLDVIRWAETNGSESNLYRKNAWLYRDYVVRSLNEDLPYNEFIRQQIAGDSLGAGEATGFLVAGPHVPAATVGREPSAIRQARADRMDEIIKTVGASVMGLTMGCARCHNHKFDPIGIKDYYAMVGVFQDIEFGGRYPEYADDHPQVLKERALQRQLTGLRKELLAYGGWEESWKAYREYHFVPKETRGLRIRFQSLGVTIDELEVFGQSEPAVNLARRTRGTSVQAFPEKGNEGRNPIDYAIDGEYGTMAWRAKVGKGADERPWVILRFGEPKRINRLRLSNNREYLYETDYLRQMPRLANYEFDLDVLNEEGQWELWEGTRRIKTKLNERYPPRAVKVEQLQAVIDQIDEEGPRSGFVGRFIEPARTYVFHRGSPENPREEVTPAAPEIMDGDLGLALDANGPERRLAFADWLVSESNPLTARVMVNRIWHHVFGQGLVATTSDFGKAGLTPTHPDLLDWLAAEFVEPTVSGEGPWSIKQMIRLMVTSEAFRRSSFPRVEAIERDAGSTLLWRYPPQRVSAEVLRDSILQASGKLNLTVGGRGYRIHDVKKTYAQWQVVDNHGPQTWRRMLYQERMRRVDDGIFTAFDFPDCGQVRAKRPVSTTPLQALNLMNSEFVIQQANYVAERARHGLVQENVKGAVVRCFELLLQRKPDTEALSAAIAIAETGGLHLVARSLMNANEFAFLP